MLGRLTTEQVPSFRRALSVCRRSRGIGDRLPEERSREGDQVQPETQNGWKEQGPLPDTSRRGCRAAVTWEAPRPPLSKEASDGGGGSHTSLEPPKTERQQTPKAQEIPGSKQSTPSVLRRHNADDISTNADDISINTDDISTNADDI